MLARWFGRFARHVIWEVLAHVAIAVAAGVTVYSVVEFVEVGNRASIRSTARDFLELAVVSVPRVLRLLFPIAVPIGVLTAVGGLCRRLEIAAFFAAGARPGALARPLMLAGVGFAILLALLTEYVAPGARAQESVVRRRMGIRYRGAVQRPNSWFKGRDRLYRVEALGERDGTQLDGLLALELSDGRLVRRWDVQRVRYDSGRWVGEGIRERELGERVETKVRARGLLPIDEAPKDFVTRVAAPRRLRRKALAEATEARARLGRPDQAHRVELYRRHAEPLAVLFVVLVAGGLSLRRGRRQTLAGAMGVGTGLGAAAWLGTELTTLVGVTGAVDPAVAVHLVPLGFLGAAILVWGRVRVHGIAES